MVHELIPRSVRLLLTPREEPTIKMWYGLYNVLLILGFPFAFGALLIKKRCRSGLLQKMGWIVPRRESPDENILWIHAVSLGEVSAIVPFVTALHRRYPGLRIVVSTVTETGREAVERCLAGMATHCFFPLDYPWIVRRFIESLRPIGFVVVETELWPNVLRALRRRGIPSIIVNGRLSSRSFARYQWIRPLMRDVLATVSLGLLQSRRDERRFVALGAAPARMHSTGNMKFDPMMDGEMATREIIGRGELGLLEDEGLIVAGSTHPAEETMLLESYRALIHIVPKAVLLMAPRHIERSDVLAHTIRKCGLPVTKRSQLLKDGCRTGGSAGAGGSRVILLDTHGELARIYGLAVMAFVGGTLVSVGGHNILEPAMWGKPVCFGPYTDHCQDIAELFIETGGGIRVRNVRELTETFLKGMQDQSWVSQVGQRARKIIDDNQGVVERNMKMIEQVIRFRRP